MCDAGSRLPTGYRELTRHIKVVSGNRERPNIRIHSRPKSSPIGPVPFGDFICRVPISHSATSLREIAAGVQVIAVHRERIDRGVVVSADGHADAQ